MKHRHLSCVLILIFSFNLFCIINVYSASLNESVVFRECYNFGGADKDNFEHIETTSDGFIVSGYSYENSFNTSDWEGTFGKGSMDGIVVKYDNQGKIQFKTNFGGMGTDNFKYLIPISDGYIAVGFTSSGGSGDLSDFSPKGANDGVIVKFNNNGDVIWANTFGGSGNDSFYSVCATTDGFIAVGESAIESFQTGDLVNINPKGRSDGIIVKFNLDGDLVWVKNYGGALNDSLNSIIPTNFGFVTVGFSEIAEPKGLSGILAYVSEAYILNCDFNGNIIWSDLFGGPDNDYFTCVTKSQDGYIAVGRSNSASFSRRDWEGVTAKGTSVYDYDSTIVKYDLNGNIVWKRNFGGLQNDYFYEITGDNDGLIACGFSSNESFGTGDLRYYTSNGGAEAVIVRYDQQGNIIWIDNFGGPSFEYCYSSAMTADGFIAVGRVGSSSFGKGDWMGVKGKGDEDAFILRYDLKKNPDITVSINEVTKSESSVNINCSFKNNVSKIQNSKAICALYNNNTLIDLVSTDLFLNDSQDEQKIITYSPYKNFNKIKVFVIDSLSNIKPISTVDEKIME